MWTERFPVGKKLMSRGRTITEGDFTLLNNLTWEISELHTDREYMKRASQFGDMILGAPCVLACSLGLASVSGLSQAIRPPGTRVVALLGFDSMKFTNPIKPGDTITVHSEIMDIRPTSQNPKRAVLRFRLVTINQKGEQVVEAISATMLESME